MSKRISLKSDLDQISYRGGTDADSQNKPTLFSERWGKKTTNNTQATAYTYTTAVADGACLFVTASLVANRTDVAGSTSRFDIRGTWRRSGSGLVAIGASSPEVSLGEATDNTHTDVGGSAWRAVLDGTSGLTVRILVTGENSKTIQWGGIIEVVEVFP